MSDEEIHLLPPNTQDTQDTIDNCSVCLEPINNLREAKTTLCNHTFHTECIDTWLERHNTCPECRNVLFDETELELPPGRNYEEYLCIFRRRYFCYFPLTSRNCMSTIYGILTIWLTIILCNSLYYKEGPVTMYIVLTTILGISLIIFNIVMFVMLRWNIQFRNFRFRRIDVQELPF